jgi:hypothetical protein
MFLDSASKMFEEHNKSEFIPKISVVSIFIDHVMDYKSDSLYQQFFGAAGGHYFKPSTTINYVIFEDSAPTAQKTLSRGYKNQIFNEI